MWLALRMYLTRHVRRTSSDRASSSHPRYKKGSTFVGGQLMEPADAQGVEMERRGQLDLILESHSFGNL